MVVSVTALSKELEQLETLRRHERKTRAAWLIGGGALLLFPLTTLIAGLKAGGNGGGLYLALVLLLLGLSVLFHQVGRARKRYCAAYKSQVIPALVRSLQPDMAYYREGNFGEHWFQNSGLYEQEYNLYESEDYLTGYIGETDFQIGEILVQHETAWRDEHGQKQTRTKTIFDGLLAVAAFPGKFAGDVFIIPDFAEKHFAWLGRAFQKLGTDHDEDLLRIDNPEFERAFVVRATDPEKAIELLTPEMQEQILTLRTRLGKDLRLAIRGAQLFIAIPSSKDWFEPRIARPASCPDQVQDLLRQLTACFRIVEDLSLNTRIRTRE